MIGREDGDDVLRELLRQARPEAVDAARAVRVRRAVHAAWRDAADRKRRWKRAAMLAAAAALVVSVTPPLVHWLRERGAREATAPTAATAAIAPIASTLFATSEVRFQHSQPARAGRAADILMPGTVVTTNGGRGTIALASGVELRLDSGTVITLESERRVSLTRGAIYLDSSNRKGPPEPVEIVARGTVVRDLGTRYEVRLSEQDLRVRVRDGLVQVASPFGIREADRGGQLHVTASAILASRTSISGADWNWILRATPPPQLEGRPLTEFLAWAAREGGRPIRFADPALERANATTIVYGAIERLTVEEALDVVLPSCGLARRGGGDVITIVAADDARRAK